jgi:glycosyltransferase involved in cell wall biosynthesis
VSQVDEEAPLIFLGRIEKVKGCHSAIAIAKATNNKLIIAGNISPLGDEQEYFKQQVEPYIDGTQILFVGSVNDSQKNEYLGKCKALLFPIEWNEPFGIVMIEAMACGTPVIAYNRGSVKEVVDEDITGYKVEAIDGMIEAVKVVQRINRKHCREQAKKRFDVQHIASNYLNVFED